MVLTQREKKIAIGLGTVLGLFLIFEGVIKPYFDARSAAAADVDAATDVRTQNNAVLTEESKLRREYKQMIANGLLDSQAEAEEQIRSALDQWARGCGVSENGLSDGQITHEGDFDQINFKLNGWGTTQTIAMLLNQCETTTFPLRVTKFAPTPVKEGQDFIHFELTVSTLYRRADGENAERSHAYDSAASTQPLKPAAIAPQGIRALAEPYRILQTRSIFAKDNRAAPVKTRKPSRPEPVTTQPTTAPSIAPYNPEPDYVLRGVGIQDGQFTAFFEQTSENKGVSRQPGDSIARGQIASMSLDGVEYVAGGKSTHISIGQSLDGRSVEGTRSTTTSTSTPSSTGDKPSWWGHHSHSETPAAPAPTSGPTTNPVDNTPKPPDGPPGIPDGDTDPVIIIEPQ